MSSPGLRERKKQKTRWAIQEHALRLFAERGYEATTVDQIAAAAEISPSTFFRYFKTKEDVVIQDEYDALMVEGIRAAPAELSPIAALRYIVRTAFALIGPEDRQKILERTQLVMSVPALRARSQDNYFVTMGLIRSAIADRTGRDPDDPHLRAFAGGVVGVLVGVLEHWWSSDGADDIVELIDQALADLEAGLPL
jgi:AcrR family transcriptional regulator